MQNTFSEAPNTSSMEISSKVLRKAIHSFLQNYHFSTSVAAVLALPFSFSVLLSEGLVPLSSSSLPTICNSLKDLFDAAGLPTSSQFFNILNHKLSQTIASSIFTLPFTVTFLLIAKASVIQALNQHNSKRLVLPIASLLSIYKPLLATFTFNTFLILSANATFFSIILVALNCAERFGLTSFNCFLFISAAGAVFYSVIFANVLVICNLALVLSGVEGTGGSMAILKASILIKGRTSIALLLSLPCNTILAAIEALFQFRVVRAYVFTENPGFAMVLDGIFIAYLYSVFIVLGTIVNVMFYRSCQEGAPSSIHRQREGLHKTKLSKDESSMYLNV